MTPEDKWRDNLPMNLKELAESQKVAYKTACRWAEDDSFPRVGRLVRRADFLKWWKGKVGCLGKASRRPRTDDCISREQSQKSGSLTALPPKAARLRGAILSHS